MDGPRSSSVNKFIVSCKESPSQYCDAQEESGWTTYLEDFSMNNYRENSSCSDDDSFGSPSLLSDAASHAAWKNCNTNINNQVMNTYSPMGGSPFLKRLNLKKPRNKKISDPDLEDTASSPVNSPKVSSFKQMDINYRKEENSSGNILGNEGRGSGQQHQEFMQTVETSSVYFDGKNNSYMDLKKKGLCLVPLSMLVNYRG